MDNCLHDSGREPTPPSRRPPRYAHHTGPTHRSRIRCGAKCCGRNRRALINGKYANASSNFRIEPPCLELYSAHFERDITPVKAAVGYRLGILLVAVVMVILPVLYVAIIGLIGWAVYYHAVHDVGIIGMAKGRAAAYTFMAYLAPIVVGVTVILFMLKPLVSWPAKRSLRKPLLRQDEPLLFDFVDRICQAVGAPRPRQIEIDEQVNASAGFRRGVLSMLGHDLVLTIGVPLVAGLNMRQFAGVLAHEFGHFARAAGMRLTYVIRSISGWFTRVVYERDRWDEWLVQMSRGADPRYGILIWLARGGVWLTRRILWCLMMIGHSVTRADDAADGV